MEDISHFVNCASICICLGLLISIIGMSILSSYFEIYYNTKIQIVDVGLTLNNVTTYTLNPVETFYCVSSISKINTCDAYIKCPNNLIKGNIYDYYCNCVMKTCSFNQLYNYWKGSPIYITISGISFSALMIICLIIRCIIKKNMQTEDIQLNEIVVA
jgi:hypothetical protein